MIENLLEKLNQGKCKQLKSAKFLPVLDGNLSV